MAADRQILSGGLCIMLAFALLLLPIQWLLSMIAAAAFHELCHFLAIYYFSGKCSEVKLYSFAAKINLPSMSRGREVMCALAGPIGGMVLLLFARWIPRVAFCAAIQSAYNLLPIYPLDGGRILQSLGDLIFPPPVADLVCRTIRMICILFIWLLAVYSCFHLKLGVFPLLSALLLMIRVK